jgi:MFS family permease
MDSPSTRPPRRGMEAFASRDFTRYQLARVAVILGAEAQAVAVAWQVYSITHRAIDLGYTGLALFLPGLFFLLPAGHVADRFDRRHVILWCYSLQVFCTAALLALAIHGTQHILYIYAVLFLIGTGRAFSAPASSALIPHLVPEKHFVNAVTWGGAIWQLSNVSGPALGGLLFTLPLGRRLVADGLEGAGIVYIFTLLSLAWFLVLIFSLSVRLGRMEHRAASLEVVMAGFKYVRSSPVLLGSMSLDLFVVLLGGAVALMMARFPISRQAGKRMFVCVAIFGACIVVFGLSRSLWLSLAVLAVSGAADSISVIIRGSLLQLATPPEMRGRVSAVNSLFIGASNELGEFESGLTAQWLGAVRATIFGGIASLAIAGVWAALFKDLRRADALTAESLRPGRKGPEGVGTTAVS